MFACRRVFFGQLSCTLHRGPEGQPETVQEGRGREVVIIAMAVAVVLCMHQEDSLTNYSHSLTKVWRLPDIFPFQAASVRGGLTKVQTPAQAPWSSGAAAAKWCVE